MASMHVERSSQFQLLNKQSNFTKQTGNVQLVAFEKDFEILKLVKIFRKNALTIFRGPVIFKKKKKIESFDAFCMYRSPKFPKFTTMAPEMLIVLITIFGPRGRLAR